MPRLTADVGLIRPAAGEDTSDQLGSCPLGEAGVCQVRGRRHRAHRRQRAAGCGRIGGTVGRWTSQHDAGHHRMDEDRQRIAGHARCARGDIGCSGFIGGYAIGEVRDASTGVSVPGPPAKAARRGLDVGNRHVGGSVRVASRRRTRALAVRCRGCADLPDLGKVQRDSIHDWGERDGGDLAGGNAGIATIAEDRRGSFRAARDRDTEWNRKQKQNSQRDKPTH